MTTLHNRTHIVKKTYIIFYRKGETSVLEFTADSMTSKIFSIFLHTVTIYRLFAFSRQKKGYLRYTTRKNIPGRREPAYCENKDFTLQNEPRLAVERFLFTELQFQTSTIIIERVISSVFSSCFVLFLQMIRHQELKLSGSNFYMF